MKNKNTIPVLSKEESVMVRRSKVASDYRCPVCNRHPDKVVKGLCRSCYSAEYATTNKDKLKVYQKQYRKARMQDPDYVEQKRMYDREYQRKRNKLRNRIFKLWQQGKLILVDDQTIIDNGH
jgi:hypothetical protein